MKVSILLITYNQENYISKAIDGFLIQNLPLEYEIILADDNSKDNTVSIVKELLKNNNLKVLETKENVGISKNYKRGFAACTGDYIAVLEGDDYWVNPNRIQKHLEFLDNHQECVLSMNRLIKFNETSEDFKIQPWNQDYDYQYFTSKEIAIENRLGNLSACVFRNSELKKLNPKIYNLSIADWMLSLALSKFGFIAVLKDATSVYRVHNKGEWSKLDQNKKLEQTIKSIDIYDKFFNYQYKKEFNICKKNLKPTLWYRIRRVSIFEYMPSIMHLFIPKILFKSLKNRL
jgi:glycosyltransferase involved in cell wall biosynthesis